MSFSFGFGWAKDDPNSHCMREERQCNENSHLVKATGSDLKSIAFQFEIQRFMMTEPVVTKAFRLSDDFEQISAFVVCRLLTKCSDCIVYPDGFLPAIKLVRGDASSFSMLKSKLGLSLLRSEETESACDLAEDQHYHIVMFEVYSCLLDRGWFAFATDHQLRGVVARFVSQTDLQVVALTNCIINDNGDGMLHMEILRYKMSPLSLDKIAEAELGYSAPPPTPLPVWRPLERAMQCVFLPTAEEVQLFATISYVPHNPTTCTLCQHRDYEMSLFLTALDVTNRARGYSTYLPDNYARARLYWELAYGIVLPKSPTESNNATFARIQTALGEQTVPLAALARGVAEVPWKDAAQPKQVASEVHQLIHTLPCFHHLHPPQRPSELSAQLRQCYHADASAPADRTGAPQTRASPFISALRMRNTQQKQGGASASPATGPRVNTKPAADLLVPTAQDTADDDSSSSGFSLFDEEASPSPPAPAPWRARGPPVRPTPKVLVGAPAPSTSKTQPSALKSVVGKASGRPSQAAAPPVSEKPAPPLLGSSDSDDFDLGSSDSEASVTQAPVVVTAAKRMQPGKPAAKAKEVKRKKTA